MNIYSRNINDIVDSVDFNESVFGVLLKDSTEAR